jgi:hypothetical protein
MKAFCDGILDPVAGKIFKMPSQSAFVEKTYLTRRAEVIGSGQVHSINGGQLMGI